MNLDIGYIKRDNRLVCRYCYNRVVLSEYKNWEFGFRLRHLLWLGDHLKNQKALMKEELKKEKNKEHCVTLKDDIESADEILAIIRSFTDDLKTVWSS